MNTDYKIEGVTKGFLNQRSCYFYHLYKLADGAWLHQGHFSYSGHPASNRCLIEYAIQTLKIRVDDELENTPD